MKNNLWMMIVCCVGPLLLFVVVPALGLNQLSLSWVFIPLMLVFCLVMMGKGGGCCGSHRQKDSEMDNKERDQKEHESH